MKEKNQLDELSTKLGVAKIKEETLSELSFEKLEKYKKKALVNLHTMDVEHKWDQADKRFEKVMRATKKQLKGTPRPLTAQFESADDTHKVRQLAGKMEAIHARAKAYSARHGCVAHINKEDDGEHHVSDWYDCDKTIATYNNGKLRESVEMKLTEGRPSQQHPLEGHEYHKKTDAELIYIAKDAHKAAEAMKSHNTAAENKYRDQANDSATVRYFRQKNGMPEWYKRKYGFVKESLDESIVGTVREAFKDAKIRDAKKKTEKKIGSNGKDKFEPDPELSTQITKQDY